MEVIGKSLLDGSLPTDALLAFAEKSKDPERASCIEAIEFATKQNPEIADESVFAYVTKTLTENTPRVKWESAKVVGNIVHLFPPKLLKQSTTWWQTLNMMAQWFGGLPHLHSEKFSN